MIERWIVLGPLALALISVGLAGALAYGFFLLHGRRDLWRAGVKTAFMAALGLALLLGGAPALLIVGALASALGDWLLAFEDEAWLKLGVGAFLAAQLAYLWLFLDLGAGFAGLELWRYAAMAAIAGSALGVVIGLRKRLGAMTGPVIAYALAISAMACAAFTLPGAAWAAMAGAVLFVISDLVLAGELFVLEREAKARRVTAPLVWWTYVGAQLGIIAGVLMAA